MKKQAAKHSTSEMLNIINAAATNLILKDKKVSLGAKIRRQQEERDYIKELVDAAAKKVAALAPELLEAEKRAYEARQAYDNMRLQHEELKLKLQSLREIQKKAEQLKAKGAEALILRESMALIRERFEKLKAMHQEKASLRGDIDAKIGASSADIYAIKERLSQMTSEQEGLSAQVSGARIMEYIESLTRETESSLASLSEYKQAGSDMLFPENLTYLIQGYTKIEGLGELISGMGRDDVIPTDLDQKTAIQIIDALKSKILEQLSAILSYENGRVSNLVVRKSEIEAEIESLKKAVESARQDISRVEADIASEQGFRDRSQAVLKGLRDDIASAGAELERLRKEAEEVSANIEFAEVFVETLTPMLVNLRKINGDLSLLMDDYRRASANMKDALGIY